MIAERTPAFNRRTSRVPSVGKFAKLFAAVAPNREFVIMESRVPYRRLPARS
jgi:hypothetical protein